MLFDGERQEANIFFLIVQPVLSDLWLRSTESTTRSLSSGASGQHGMALRASFPPSYHSHPSLLGSTIRKLSTSLRTCPACSCLYAIIHAYNAFSPLPTLTQHFLPGKPDISLRPRESATSATYCLNGQSSLLWAVSAHQQLFTIFISASSGPLI